MSHALAVLAGADRYQHAVSHSGANPRSSCARSAILS
jgi:hypothetical protein